MRKFLQSLTNHKINEAVKQTRREFAYDHLNWLPNKAITHPCVYCNTTESLYFQTKREIVYDDFNCLPKKVITHPCVYCNTTESLYFQIVYVTNVDLYIINYHIQRILSTTTEAQSPSEEAKCSSKTAFTSPFLSAHPHKRPKHSFSEGLFIL